VSVPYPNRIVEARTALGLSQRALAKAVGTSQQQIQRIETGIQAVRIDLAASIAQALKSSLAELFPKIQTQPVAKKSRRNNDSQPPISPDVLRKAGIQSDPSQWTLRLGFEDGREFNYAISAAEKERVSSIIWNATFDFFVFDADTKRVAANRSKINYAHFLFGFGVAEEEKELESFDLIANFIGSKDAIKFGVDPDDVAVENDDEGFGSQLQNMFFSIEGLDADDDNVIWFDDEDGERVYLRTRQILLIELPLLCCEPALWKSHVDNSDDNDTEEFPDEARMLGDGHTKRGEE
jgi:transcriptional regulator with XRE-family HTH domain